MPFKTSNPLAKNLGNGTTIYAGLSGETLNFKSLTAGAGVSLSNNSTGVTICSSVVDTGIGWSNLAGGSTVAGCGTMASGSTALCNTLYGVNAGKNTTTGYQNVGVGYNVLQANTIGNNNVALGQSALYSNTGGTNNIALGQSALQSSRSGENNVAIGLCALTSNISGYENIANGHDALYCNTTGYENIGIGFGAMRGNTSGIYNIGIGTQALYSNSCGTYNIALGYLSMISNISGSSNVSIGNCSLRFNIKGNNNIVIGEAAGTGGAGASFSNNIIIGIANSLCDMTGSYNVSIGENSLCYNTNGCFNTTLGYGNIRLGTSVACNTAIGAYAGNCTTGNTGVFLGYCAGYNEKTGCKLYIDNSSTSTPLIYGEFDNDILKFNACTYIRDVGAGASSDKILTWNPSTCAVRSMPYMTGATRLATYTTTATAGSSTTLTVSSSFLQYFTGTLNQIVVLPVVSTLSLGFQFKIINKSTGIITVNSSGGNTLIVLSPLISLTLTCIAITGTGIASWSIEETDVTSIASGEKILRVTPNGMQADVDFINPVIAAGALEALAESAWVTGIATSTGIQGQVAYGTSYKYDCIGTNAWIRTLILETRVDLYLTPDFNDSVNEGDSVSLDVAYPTAIIGQKVWGTTKNVYEKKNTNLWKKMSINFGDMDFLPKYVMVSGVTSGYTINILATYDIVSIVVEAETTTGGTISIGSVSGLTDIVDSTVLPIVIGTKKQLNYLVNADFPQSSARNIYVGISSAASVKLHMVQQKMFK